MPLENAIEDEIENTDPETAAVERTTNDENTENTMPAAVASSVGKFLLRLKSIYLESNLVLDLNLGSDANANSDSDSDSDSDSEANANANANANAKSEEDLDADDTQKRIEGYISKFRKYIKSKKGTTFYDKRDVELVNDYITRICSIQGLTCLDRFEIFNKNTNEDESFAISLKETLGLVIAATIDKTIYSLEKNDSTIPVAQKNLKDEEELLEYTEKNDKTEQTEKNLAFRIETLFNTLKDLCINRRCHQGQRHDMTLILNKVYPDTSIIEDFEMYTIDLVKSYVGKHMRDNLNPEELFALYKQNIEANVTQNMPAEEMDLYVNELIKIKHNEHAALEAYLATQFIGQGLNPESNDSKEVIQKVFAYFKYIKLPNDIPHYHLIKAILQYAEEVEEHAMPLLVNESIGQAKKLLNACTTFEDPRFNTLVVFDEGYRLYQTLKHVRVGVFIGAEEGEFIEKIYQHLEEFFTGFLQIEIEDESIQSQWCQLIEPLNQLAKGREEYNLILQKPFVENFFACWARTNKVQRRALLERLLNEKSQIQISDEQLLAFLEKNTYQESGITLLSPYEINRVLLHAIVVQPTKWSETFFNIFKQVLNFIEEGCPQSCTNEAWVSSEFVKSSYPELILKRLQCLRLVRQSYDVLQDLLIDFALPDSPAAELTEEMRTAIIESLEKLKTEIENFISPDNLFLPRRLIFSETDTADRVAFHAGTSPLEIIIFAGYRDDDYSLAGNFLAAVKQDWLIEHFDVRRADELLYSYYPNDKSAQIICRELIKKLDEESLRRIMKDSSELIAILEILDEETRFPFIEKLGIDYILQNCVASVDHLIKVVDFIDSIEHKHALTDKLSLEWLGNQAGYLYDFLQVYPILSDEKLSLYLETLGGIPWLVDKIDYCEDDLNLPQLMSRLPSDSCIQLIKEMDVNILANHITRLSDFIKIAELLPDYNGHLLFDTLGVEKLGSLLRRSSFSTLEPDINDSWWYTLNYSSRDVEYFKQILRDQHCGSCAEPLQALQKHVPVNIFIELVSSFFSNELKSSLSSEIDTLCEEKVEEASGDIDHHTLYHQAFLQLYEEMPQDTQEAFINWLTHSASTYFVQNNIISPLTLLWVLEKIDSESERMTFLEKLGGIEWIEGFFDESNACNFDLFNILPEMIFNKFFSKYNVLSLQHLVADFSEQISLSERLSEDDQASIRANLLSSSDFQFYCRDNPEILAPALKFFPKEQHLGLIAHIGKVSSLLANCRDFSEAHLLEILNGYLSGSNRIQELPHSPTMRLKCLLSLFSPQDRAPILRVLGGASWLTNLTTPISCFEFAELLNVLPSDDVKTFLQELGPVHLRKMMSSWSDRGLQHNLMVIVNRISGSGQEKSAKQLALLNHTPSYIRVLNRYNPAFDGKAVRYSRLFAETRALFSGERSWFANTRAWWRGEGKLFANTQATLLRKRGLFANTRLSLNIRAPEHFQVELEENHLPRP